jgi:hypothetical protein
MLTRGHFAFVLLAALSVQACAAFLVERGPLVLPSRTLTPPEVGTLARLRDPQETIDLWTRETRVGLGGYVEAILWDPAAARSRLAYEIALNHLGRAAAEDLIRQRWLTLYGVDQDRFAIDLRWRFDEQFIVSRRILDPTVWNFELQTASGKNLAPLAVAVLRTAVSPEQGAWRGEVRLWFPWRDQARMQLLLGGETPWVRLTLKHFSGSGEVMWRFPGSW